jgi:hypothetical protein
MRAFSSTTQQAGSSGVATTAQSRLGRLLGAPVGVGRLAGVRGRCTPRLRTGRENPKFLRTNVDYQLHLPHQEYLAETETWRQWEAWATPMEDWTARLKERTPLERPKPTVNNERPLLAADALEWLAWHTGYPVISDASRYVLAWYRDSLDNPRALLTWLSNDLWLRFDPSGYLLARHKRFWTLNQFEIPERFVRPLEAKWQAWQWLSLDDYATLAAAITDEQARGFTRVRRERKYSVPHGVRQRPALLGTARVALLGVAERGAAAARTRGRVDSRKRAHAAAAQTLPCRALSRLPAATNNCCATCPTTTRLACMSLPCSAVRGYRNSEARRWSSPLTRLLSACSNKNPPAN